jgi:tRNA pseudouridine55 synthase
MFLLIDKPKGITSHDVVDRVRKVTGEKKVGHAGTLDPNATGLLIIGVGRQSTKKLGDLTKNTDKEYVAEVFLGKETDTDDAEGVVISKSKGVLPPGETEIKKGLTTFKGEQKQTPPIFSAIKTKGKKAYAQARKGKNVKLEPRDIKVHSIKLLHYKFPIVEFKVKVSSGTYIRALARDMGKKLGCGAYLNNLERTKVGDYSLDNAVKLDYLTKDNWEKLAINICKRISTQ